MCSEKLKEHDDYVSPRSETERKIAQIWEKTLNLDRVGVRENFLDLGGDSLHVIRVMNDIHSAWAIQLSVEQLMEHKTVESLARVVDQMAASIDEGRTSGLPSESEESIARA